VSEKKICDAGSADGQGAKADARVMPIEPQITFDVFSKVDLRVCRVIQCEAVRRSKKLLRLELDDGLNGRIIVSGIHPWYEPEDLIGKKIIVIANLEPAKFCNVESQGMLLAGDDANGACKIVFVDETIPVGFRIH